MPNPTIKIHNVKTGEVVEREMTAQELVQWELDQAQAKSEREAKAAKAAEKVALLEKLGITEEEAKLLLA